MYNAYTGLLLSVRHACDTRNWRIVATTHAYNVTWYRNEKISFLIDCSSHSDRGRRLRRKTQTRCRRSSQLDDRIYELFYNPRSNIWANMPEDSNKKLYYNTVLCQAFSPTGNFLLAGNIYGDVSIYNLPKVLGPGQTDNENELPGPTYNLSAHPDSQVQSMVATDHFLVTGSAGEIAGWDWNIILSNKASKAKPSWNIQIPADKDSFEKPDVNCIVYCKENQVLYLGCGDNKIYIVQLEDGKILRQLAGHKDYIHGLARINNQLASSSEDGTVRLWDLRKSENTNILTPHLNNKVARPHLGKWIGAVDFTEDWLLCGGGPNLSLWHLRTMEAAMIFDLPDEGIHVAEIYEERIIAAGIMPNTYHLTYQGDVLAKIPTSSNTVYSIVFQETPHKVLSIAGSSNDIDVCTNFNYRELVLKFA